MTCRARLTTDDGKSWRCTADHRALPPAWEPFGGHRWEENDRPTSSTLDPLTAPIEEVDAELRAAGIDPVELGKRGVAFVEKLKAKRRASDAPPRAFKVGDRVRLATAMTVTGFSTDRTRVDVRYDGAGISDCKDASELEHVRDTDYAPAGPCCKHSKPEVTEYGFPTIGAWFAVGCGACGFTAASARTEAKAWGEWWGGVEPTQKRGDGQ